MKENQSVISRELASDYRCGRPGIDADVLNYLHFRRKLEVVVLIVLSPLILLISLIIAIVVCIDMRGSIFYLQTRIGMQEKSFTLIKFKTMRSSRRQYSMKHESDRVSAAGHFLRKHRLDEIPQLWNVLLGDMSLVGPRPEIDEHYLFYKNVITGYELRKLVPQGLTGLAQVSMPHTTSITGAKQKLSLDIEYISQISLWNDFRIILRTIPTMVFAKGGR
jgi:lipopolysaccharide/colanic/teichoic acid biosynthesis glycosyltransferase